MGLLSWVVFGLIAGILAKFFMPGPDGGGFLLTILVGIAGAVVGGFIATALGMGDVTGFNFRSLIIAVVGGVLVLFIFRRLRS